MLRVGDTLVSFILMSDGTHLSNCAADKKEWAVCLTIGNLFSKIHQMPSMPSDIMVALLPILIKNWNFSQKQRDEQRQQNREVLKKVLRWLLQPLTFGHNPGTVSWY
jgi:hypothetical protein